MKCRNQGRRAILIALMITVFFAPMAFSGVAWNDDCARDLQKLVEDRGLGNGWITVADFHKFRRAHNIDVLDVFPVFQCPSCNNLYPNHLHNGKSATQCEGCGTHFNQGVEVHPGKSPEGEDIVNMAGLRTSRDGKPLSLRTVIKAPLRCTSCSNIIEEGKDNCASCGASRADAIRQPVRWGAPLVITQDPSDHQGVTAKPETPTKPQEDLWRSGMADTAAHTLDRLNRMDAQTRRFGLTSRQWSGLGAVGLVSGIAAYWYANSGPTLEEPDEEEAEVIEKLWYRDILIQKKNGKRWSREGMLYHAEGTDKENPEPRWSKDAPKEQLDSPQEYKVTREPHYILRVKKGGKVFDWEVGSDEFKQWQTKDRVELKVKDNGAVQGAKRVGRAK